MLAYHNDPSIKSDILAQLEAHRKADEIIKGQYWECGKGCAVGCTIHSGHHAEYETRFGIPEMVAHLEDAIFEGLPNDQAMGWPVCLMSAIEPGADLSLVGWKFLHWLITDETVNPGINHPLVKDAVKKCADILLIRAEGGCVDAADSAAAEAAGDAAAAAAAADAARAAAGAARAAAVAAWAVWAAGSETAAAADATAWAAGSAAAWAAAGSAAWSLMADKLIQLIKAT